jgi:hypothetical protein
VPRRATHPIYLELGSKRVFASSIAWPGWARSGRDEDSAIEAVLAYAPRYAAALRGTRLGFTAPTDHAALVVEERLAGNATTDFGAPDASPTGDDNRVDEVELERLERILRAAWRTFDRAVEAAQGAELTKGPRGGGRDLDKIVDHVLGADEGYVRMLGRRIPSEGTEPAERIDRIRVGVLEALDHAVREGVPPSPRGGKRWSPRFFVRRSAWHVLDHAWELEDRTPASG